MPEQRNEQRSTQSTDDSMDVDEGSMDDDGEVVPIHTIALVNEKDLDSTQ